MSEEFAPDRVHVVVGTPWKDAVISLLEPSSPYEPWPDVLDARRGDGVVVVIDCEPRLVLPYVLRVEFEGGAGQAITQSRQSCPGPAVAVSRVGAGLDGLRDRCTLFEGAQAAALVGELDRHRFDGDDEFPFGVTSMAEAAVLLESNGRCSGCDKALGLGGENAREKVAIWTVAEARVQPEAAPPEEPQLDDLDGSDGPWLPTMPVDWPAALCLKCQDAMREGGFETFLDYRFSRHPACPRCGQRRARRAVFGMLSSFTGIGPWHDARGCCDTPDNWTCAMCGHRW